MSQFCRPKVRTTFRKGKIQPGNHPAPLGYPDQANVWRLYRSMVKHLLAIKNPVVQEKAS